MCKIRELYTVNIIVNQTNTRVFSGSVYTLVYLIHYKLQFILQHIIILQW